MKDIKKFQKIYQKKQPKRPLTPQAIRTLLRSAQTEVAWKGWSISQSN
jgi:hypothetical protein